MAIRKRRIRKPSPPFGPAEIQAVLQFANHAAGESEAGFDGEISDADLDAFWRFLRYHRLTNLAWTLLDGDCPPAGRSDGFLRRLRENQAKGLPRVQRLWSQLQRVVFALQESAIDHLVLKGFPLSWQLYGCLHARNQADIDILVRLEQLPRLIDCLGECGLSMKGGRERIKPQKLRTEHAVAFYGQGGSVDVHWRLRTAPAYAIDDEAIWESCRQTNVAGKSFTTLSDEYQLTLSQCHHEVKASERSVRQSGGTIG